MFIPVSSFIFHLILLSEFAVEDDLIEGNDDLFWAVLGGSPGNFGILTHVRLRPLHDKDYPDSRMMNFMVNYTPEKHLAFQKLLAEWSGDSEMPRNFDFILTIMGRRSPQFEGPKVFDLIEKSGKRKFKGLP